MLNNHNTEDNNPELSSSKIFRFLKENIYLIIAFTICTFLVFYNLGKIEFWGEDEGQTLFYATRFLIGLVTGSHENLTAFYTNTTLSTAILIQVPSIILFGVREVSARIPSAVVTVLTLFVLHKIGKLYFNKKSLNILILLFAVSGATGLFKSAIGVGFYIFFILLAFYKIEKFLFSPAVQERKRLPDLVQSILYLTIALIFVPDAYFYVPYFAILILINIRRIGIKRLLISLVVPVCIFVAFCYFQFLFPRNVLGYDSGTYQHLLGRKSGLVFSFNLRNLVLGYITNYSIYFVILFIAAVIILIYLRSKRIAFFPRFIGRMILLFSLHSIFWFFLVKHECGHLMNSYPVFMFIIAFSTGQYLEYLDKNTQPGLTENHRGAGSNKKRLKKIIKGIAMGLITVLLLLNFYHTFILFNDLSLDKDKYPMFYKLIKVPCGYLEGHKTGIKSAAYILRKEKLPGQILVSDKGVAFNFIYMGGGFTSYSSKDAIDRLKDGENILEDYNIRYVGIDTSYPDTIYIDTIENMGFDKIVIEHNGREIYYIYDVAKKNGKVTTISRDEFDSAYHKEYISIYTALPDYV